MSKILSTWLRYAHKARLAALPRDALRRDKVAIAWQIRAMPVVWRENGLVFFFYSKEGNEAPHVHVRRGSGKSGPRAKVWLATAEPVDVHGFSGKDQRKILQIVRRENHAFYAAWAAHFG